MVSESSHMNRAELPGAIREQKLIAVLRRLGTERIHAIAPILDEAGIGVFEVTMDGPEALPSIEWLKSNGYVVGAGTVRSAELAAAANRAGAAFAVAPDFNPTVTGTAATLGLPMIPGGLTPTEISTAWGAGACAVKLFPASIGGPQYLAAVRSPLPDVPLIPTGGVTADNAAAYLEAGAVAVGLGGWLTGIDDMYDIARRATVLVDSVEHLR